MKYIKRAFYILKNEGIIAFFKKFIKFFNLRINIFMIPFAILKIKKIKEKFKKTNDLDILISYTFKYYFISPTQINEEIKALLAILKNKKLENILEIGTASGGTLFLFSQIADGSAKIISIDLPGGKFGGGYSFWRIPIYQAFKKENQKLYLLRKDSHNQETLKEAKKILNNNQLDFLFIDGDHTYEGVKKDFEMYGSLVRKGGIIAFHDINPGFEYDGVMVPKFWQEIKNQFVNIEFIENENQMGYGIDVILK